MLKNIFFRSFAVIVSALFVSGCSQQSGSGVSYTTVEGSVWHTTMKVTYGSDEDLSDSILAVTNEIEMSLSPFQPESVISRINRGDTLAVNDDIARVFAESQRINRLSGGLFDPTVAPLVNMWGFGYAGGDHEPTDAEIDSCLALVGIDECKIAGGVMTKKSHATQFNFSAIAKGYGIDRVADMLRRHGIENYMVEIGGELSVGGVNAGGEKWRVQIDAPVEDKTGSHERLRVIEVTDCGIATSGNYRNYHDTAHGRVGHTISPVTGKPIKSQVLSATVIAPTAMTADALATALMAMDAADGLRMIEALDSVEAMIVTRDSDAWKITASSRFPI